MPNIPLNVESSNLHQLRAINNVKYKSEELNLKYQSCQPNVKCSIKKYILPDPMSNVKDFLDSFLSLNI